MRGRRLRCACRETSPGELCPRSVGHRATNLKNRFDTLDEKRSETLATSCNQIGGPIVMSLLTLRVGEPTARPTERPRRPFIFRPFPTRSRGPRCSADGTLSKLAHILFSE